jgi:hypothetical protein
VPGRLTKTDRRRRGEKVAELFGRWSFERVDLIAAFDNLFDVE